jgi:hypothetical protein
VLINLATVLNAMKRAKETMLPYQSTSQKVNGSDSGGHHAKDAKDGNQNGKILSLSRVSQDSLQWSTSQKVNHSDSVDHHAKDANQENQNGKLSLLSCMSHDSRRDRLSSSRDSGSLSCDRTTSLIPVV